MADSVAPLETLVSTLQAFHVALEKSAEEQVLNASWNHSLFQSDGIKDLTPCICTVHLMIIHISFKDFFYLQPRIIFKESILFCRGFESPKVDAGYVHVIVFLI